VDTSSAEAFADRLRRRDDCTIEPGLSTQEITHAEAATGVTFPPLWQEVLKIVHPVELPEPPRSADGVLRWTRFPDWRMRDPDSLQWMLDGPADGVLFDVEHNMFWWRSWGDRPTVVSDALALARTQLAAVPRLTPLWSHLYVGSIDQSPVFSIVQTDVYVPALTLESFVAGTSQSESGISIESYPLGDVPFWTMLHAWSQVGHTTSFGELAQSGT
jgi:hypothetical protein